MKQNFYMRQDFLYKTKFLHKIGFFTERKTVEAIYIFRKYHDANFYPNNDYFQYRQNARISNA